MLAPCCLQCLLFSSKILTGKRRLKHLFITVLMETELIKAKPRVHLLPGNIAISLKWKDTQIHNNLKSFFNAVKIQDLMHYDFCLPEHCFIYLEQQKLLNGLEQSLADLRKLNLNHESVIIADRNNMTVETFSKLQWMLSHQNTTVIPVGHHGEIPLVLHQFHQLESGQHNSSRFNQPSKLQPDVQLQILLNVPGLGSSKASKLLNVFGTIQRIGFASVEDLVPVVGVASASKIHRFFNGMVNS